MRKLKLDELNRPGLEDYRARAKLPLAVLLDNVRSGLNVGSVFRTADAFALEQLVLCGITARPPHREILKTAIGATESVAWTYRAGVAEAVAAWKARGYWAVGVEQTDESIPLQEWRRPAGAPLLVLFGNEVDGLSEEVLPLLDQAVEVPQFGTKHSLNVSVCAGIVLWELMRQYRFG